MVKYYRTDDKKIYEVSELTQGIWIDMVNPTVSEGEEVAEKLNIDLKEQKHLLEEQIKKIQEELSKITSQEEHIDSRKVEIDSLLEKYKTIDKEKEEELNKNIEDKRREEEHIKLKEEEKKYLQL